MPQILHIPIPFAVLLTAFCNHPHCLLILNETGKNQSGLLTQSFKAITKPQHPEVSLGSSSFMNLHHISWIFSMGTILWCNKILKNYGGCDSCSPCDQEYCCCLEFLLQHLVINCAIRTAGTGKQSQLFLPCTQMYTQSLWNQLGA